MRRLLVLAVVALVVVGVAGCGVGPGGATRTDPTGPGSGPPPRRAATTATVGSVPVRATGPEVRITTCRIDPDDGDTAQVEAILVNTDRHPRLLQGVPVVVRDRRGDRVSTDHEELWSSISIGPGRRLRLRDDLDLERPVDGPIHCVAGAPDLRPTRLGGDRRTDPDLGVSGCDPVIEATYRNRSGRPVGVSIWVEAFDDAGFSAGTFELGQYPTIYTDGRQPDETEVALAPGATGRYRLDPRARVEDYGTPLDGPIVGCEVVGVRVTANPEPREVIVD